MSQVSFTVALTSAVGISLTTNPTVISFYPGNTIASVSLFINDATLWTVGKTTSLSFTPTATTTTYATTPTTNIVLTATAAPGIPITTLTLQNTTLNSLAFNVKCS
jgi:hypothetical protein